MALAMFSAEVGFGQTATEAQPVPPPAAPAQRSAADLEKLAMPIALHPDPLIAVILPASVYPVEIVQAARFVRDTNNIPLVDQQPWDENVKAVAKFPDLIAKMDGDLAWTVQLGQAFLDQPKELMDAIQALRLKAQQAGTLQTTPQQVVTVTNTVVQTTVEQQVVVVTNTVVQIQPSSPQVVYVPTYTTAVYYPPPYYVYDPYAPLVTFGMGMAVGAIIANNCDWHHGEVYHSDVNVNIDRDVNRDRNVNRGDRPANRPANAGNRPNQQKWQPDQNRLRSSGAGGASAANREARGWGSGAARPSTQPVSGARPTASTGAAGPRPAARPTAPRPATPTAGARPSTGTVGARPSTGAVGSRSSVSTMPASRPAQPRASQGSAFGGVNSGGAARNFSNRGAASRGGGGRAGGRR